jgi:hypothetical protein
MSNSRVAVASLAHNYSFTVDFFCLFLDKVRKIDWNPAFVASNALRLLRLIFSLTSPPLLVPCVLV